MRKRSIEPLDPETWFGRLKKLLADAQGDEGFSQDALVRQAYHLVRLAPGPFADILPVDLEERDVEKMIDCGAYESAVMALIGPRTTFTVHKDVDAKLVRAELSLDPKLTPGQGAHVTCAKAMLQAWVRCLAITAGVELPAGVKNQGPRKSRSGWPPSSTEH